MAARLEPQKGHQVLLRAMARLKAEFPNLRLVALGEGSLRAELQGLVRELGLENSVLMPGHCPDVRGWMSAADVCVLPSFAEGLPLFAIECLAASRPMVASAVDGTPEIVINGKTGLTVAAGDPVALALAIARLLRDPRLAVQLGAAGAEWVRQRFTLERQIREDRSTLRTIMVGKDRQHSAATARGEIAATVSALLKTTMSDTAHIGGPQAALTVPVEDDLVQVCRETFGDCAARRGSNRQPGEERGELPAQGGTRDPD